MANEETQEKAEKTEKVSRKAKRGATTFKTVDQQGKADYPPRLQEKYRSEVVPLLMKEFNYENPMQVPQLRKITLNMGLGAAVTNPNIVQGAIDELSLLAGQKAVLTRSRKSISNFKLRENMPIGCMVTLRRDRMWEFLDRLVSMAMPRMRDFKGISGKAFDGRGNYSLGLREQIVFPEINYDKVEHVKGMNITMVTTAKNDPEAKALLRHLGLPFRN